MKKYKPHFKVLGQNALILEWPARVSESILFDILSVKQHLHKALFGTHDYEAIISYHTLTLLFKEDVDFLDLKNKITNLLQNPRQALIKERQLWEIPVCYEEQFAPDILELSKNLKLSVNDLIALHTRATYTVYAMGFLPGFMYLGGLNSRLHYKRRAIPRLDVAAGSVGIGGKQTGIYPQVSPGGWNLIGNCPLKLFDAKRENQVFINVGDRVRFVEISFPKYELTKIEVETELYEFQSSKINDKDT